jgi:hypothetical protein
LKTAATCPPKGETAFPDNGEAIATHSKDFSLVAARKYTQVDNRGLRQPHAGMRQEGHHRQTKRHLKRF